MKDERCALCALSSLVIFYFVEWMEDGAGGAGVTNVLRDCKW